MPSASSWSGRTDTAMWIALAIVSALCLGCYDIAKKVSLKGNNVLTVLFLNTLFCTLLMSPVIIGGAVNGSFGFGNEWAVHLKIILKAVIVLSSWVLGYFSIKHLPLTIAGPINASRPVMVLVGALLIFGERLNVWQWSGVILGFGSLFLITRIGGKEGFSFSHSRWLWMSIGAAVMGAVSALYDKYLLKSYQPLEVQAWYSFYQFLLMGGVLLLLLRKQSGGVRFVWRWSILFISIFLTVADLAYFYSLSLPGAMIAIVSMLRRGSVVVSFSYGVLALGEKDVRSKAIDLAVLLIGLSLLIIGSLR